MEGIEDLVRERITGCNWVGIPAATMSPLLLHLLEDSYAPCDTDYAFDQMTLDSGSTLSPTFSHYLSSRKCMRGLLLLLISGLPHEPIVWSTLLSPT